MIKINKFRVHYIEPIIMLVEIMLIIVLTNCSTSQLRVSEFKFTYNNQNYIVRSSYSKGNPESCNQLIGNNFVAFDLNQDRIIDKIDKGPVSLAAAQEIYDYCLDFLEKKNKLNEVGANNNKYTLSVSDFIFEVKTFYQAGVEPFNEFVITSKRQSKEYLKISVYIDNGADGILDEQLKGLITLNEAQRHYKKVLLEGLKSNDLKKTNTAILTK